MADIRRNTTVLDDFNRADETPLSGGGNWAQLDSGIWGPLVLKDNTVTHHPSYESCMSYWTPETYDGDDAECWGKLIGGGGFGLGAGVGLFTVVGGSGTVTGYRLRAVGVWHLQKWVSGSFSDLATDTPVGDDSGRIMLIRRNGDDVECWRSGYEDWTTWELIVSATDTDYTTDMYAALWVADSSYSQLLGFDFFGAGAEEEWMPEFIRRPWEHHGGKLAP